MLGVPRVPARRDRRPPREAAAGRPRQHPVPRRDRRRAARRRVDRPGDPAHPHRRRRDEPPRDDRRACSRCSSTPTSWRSCATTPPRIEVGVEELLRWVSPIKNMARTVTRDVELHGADAARGRSGDPDVPVGQPRRRPCSTTPTSFDVRRDPNPHLAFGFGPHFCMGASLARLELKVMFSELLRRLPDLHLAGDPLPRRVVELHLRPRGHARGVHAGLIPPRRQSWCRRSTTVDASCAEHDLADHGHVARARTPRHRGRHRPRAARGTAAGT